MAMVDKEKSRFRKYTDKFFELIWTFMSSIMYAFVGLALIKLNLNILQEILLNDALEVSNKIIMLTLAIILVVIVYGIILLLVGLDMLCYRLKSIDRKMKE